MARFAGYIGFVKTEETAPGVFDPVATERFYYGDILKFSRRWQSGESINDNIVLNNEISILADPYILENFEDMRYVVLNNSKWRIDNADSSQYPRVTLSIGGVYNG